MHHSPLDPFYGITEADIDGMSDAQVESLLRRASAYSHENAALIDLAFREVNERQHEVLDLSTPEGARRFNAYLDQGAWDLSSPIDRADYFAWCEEHGVDPNEVPSFEVVGRQSVDLSNPDHMSDSELLAQWSKEV